MLYRYFTIPGSPLTLILCRFQLVRGGSRKPVTALSAVNRFNFGVMGTDVMDCQMALHNWCLVGNDRTVIGSVPEFTVTIEDKLFKLTSMVASSVARVCIALE